MFHKKRSAFTLIELLVVIAIIGILATIAVVALQNARAKARDARRVADVKQIQTALELFFNDQNRYPTTNEFAVGLIFSTSTNGTTTYMAKVPVAPTPNDNACATSDNNYIYSSNDGATYTLKFCLGGPSGSIQAGVNSASLIGISYVGVGNSNLLAAGGCSCSVQSLPCCDRCNPANAECTGGTYCARNANCSSGQYCVNGTCTNITGPQTVDGLAAWYKADAGVVTTTGNYVSQWNDQSGNGKNLLQAASAAQPILVNNQLNNNPVINFNGSTDFMATANFSTPLFQPNTIFVVWNKTDSKNAMVYSNNSPNILGYYWGGVSGYAGKYISYSRVSTWSYIISSAIFNGASSYIFENGTVMSTGDSSSNIINGITIGNVWAGEGEDYYLKGNIAEMLFYNKALSDIERQQVGNYLNSKYNIY